MVGMEVLMGWMVVEDKENIIFPFLKHKRTNNKYNSLFHFPFYKSLLLIVSIKTIQTAFSSAKTYKCYLETHTNRAPCNSLETREKITQHKFNSSNLPFLNSTLIIY